MTGHDLLTEPLLSWRDAQRRRAKTTLPGLLARLGSGDLADFPRVRTHQFHPWSMFLTQLAAIGLRRAGESDPRLSEVEWRERLLALTGGAHEPWCVVVDDLTKPAFLQAPVPEGHIDKWNVSATTPDDLDVLVTAKAHDLKRSLIAPLSCEPWTYALCILQTAQGFLGAGNYGVSRMNGGFATRVRVGLGGAASPCERFKRDISVLLGSWDSQISRGYSEKGVALVWTEPWDGKSSLDTDGLCPHFIEICRRVRLRSASAGLEALATSSKGPRCLPTCRTGDVGDPWIPVKRSDRTALNIGARGFDYKLTSELLFGGEYEPAAAQVPRNEDGDPIWVQLAALARGQGKTEGLHERALGLSGRVIARLGHPDQRAALGRRAGQAVADADTMRGKVLYPALQRLALGGEVYPHRFDARVDELFFDQLFTHLEADDDAARLSWDSTLRDIASRELNLAIDRCCLPDARRYKAISAAEGTFRGCLKKQFPDLAEREAS